MSLEHAYNEVNELVKDFEANKGFYLSQP